MSYHQYAEIMLTILMGVRFYIAAYVYSKRNKMSSCCDREVILLITYK